MRHLRLNLLAILHAAVGCKPMLGGTCTFRVKDHPPAVALWLIVIEFEQSVLPIRNVVATVHLDRPHLREGQLTKVRGKWNHAASGFSDDPWAAATSAANRAFVSRERAFRLHAARQAPCHQVEKDLPEEYPASPSRPAIGSPAAPTVPLAALMAAAATCGPGMTPPGPAPAAPAGGSPAAISSHPPGARSSPALPP